MTSRERVEAVLNGEKPDRVPVHDLSNIVIAKIAGYQMKDLRFDAEKSVGATLDFNRKSKSDFILGPCVESPAMFMDLGIDISLPDDNYGNVMGSYFTTPEDVDSKELYDPFDPKESPYLRTGILDKIALLNKKNDTGALTAGWSWGVMTTAGFARGVENLLMDLLTEPDLARKVIKKASRLVDGVMTLGLESGSDSVWLPDPTASGTIISGDTYQEFIAEETKRLVKGWKAEYNVPVILHICGDTVPIMDVISQLGVDCFSVDHAVDIAVAREKLGDGLTLMGNVHPIDALWNGTPQDVIKASAECIEKAGKDGRFILSLGCEMPRDAPMENICAMQDAVEKFGRY
ncbi:MAG: hypothetical protein GX307_04135 [Euryarchaeota archaeon]|nr:hypothetical protein [Euryarchaeota archaeon]